MKTNKELRELAEGVKHWGNSIADAWPSDPDFNDTWSAGAIDEDGNKYPVIEVDADQYDAPGDSERLARFFTAANPATIMALMDEVEALQTECAALRKAAEISAADANEAERELETVKAEREELRNGLKNARYRIEQGRIWNGMGWSLTGLHAYQQQRALDEIAAAMEGGKP